MSAQPTLPGIPDSPMPIRKGRRKETARGYAAAPGTGPEGETCGTCKHLVRIVRTKTYPKCGLNRAAWSCTRRTDVLVRAPACEKWEADGD